MSLGEYPTRRNGGSQASVELPGTNRSARPFATTSSSVQPSRSSSGIGLRNAGAEDLDEIAQPDPGTCPGLLLIGDVAAARIAYQAITAAGLLANG